MTRNYVLSEVLVNEVSAVARNASIRIPVFESHRIEGRTATMKWQPLNQRKMTVLMKGCQDIISASNLCSQYSFILRLSISLSRVDQ